MLRDAATLARLWKVLLVVTAVWYAAWLLAARRRRAALAGCGASAVVTGMVMLAAVSALGKSG